jgi:hypothetical protein
MNPRSVALAALTAGLMVGCSAAPGSAAHAGTSGEGGILSGNQVFAPINVPITVCGNAVSILGSAAAGCGYEVVVKPSKKKPHHHDNGPSTSGKGGILSGNQVFAPINVPITACGTAVALVGQAEAGCQVLVETGEGGSEDGHHGGDSGGGHHHGNGSGDDHHGKSEGGHHAGNGHHGNGSQGGHHGSGSGSGHHGGGSGGGHHGGGSGGGSGGGHHAAGSGTGSKHNGGTTGGSGSHETSSAAAGAAPAPHSTGHAHKQGGLPVTGVSTGLFAGLGVSGLVAGAILVAVGRRRRTGAAEGGAPMS